MATSSFVIGELDDVRYFDHPDRFNADIMWFTKGYVEYVIPNLIPRNQKITQLSLSAEISSEAPGIDNNWPSDISFTLMTLWSAPGPLPVTMEMYAECSPLNGGLKTGINTVSSSFWS